MTLRQRVSKLEKLVKPSTIEEINIYIISVSANSTGDKFYKVNEDGTRTEISGLDYCKNVGKIDYTIL